MLPALQEGDSLPSRDLSENQCSEHRNSVRCGTTIRKSFDNGSATSDRLDTGRAGAEIIDWSDALDPVRLEPSNRLDLIVGQSSEITSISQLTRRIKHILFKTRREPIRCPASRV